MFNKTIKSLTALLAAIFAAVLLGVGAALLAPKTQKAYAAEGDVVQVKASTTKSYATFDDAITDIGNISNGNVEIKLLGNAMATKELSSGNNAKYFTLDLNGYALTVNAPVKCARLTLKDSMAGTTDSAYLHEISNPTTADTTDTVQIYGGVLTNPSGRALNVGYTYDVTMESGTIAGCADSGVYVDRGDFTMTGGTISYNTATYGGGVYIQEGDFTMTGGTISYNTTTEKNGGGGVCVASSTTFNISGAPKIKDNKRSTDDHAKDVSSYNDAINVNGALTVGAEIYIDWTVKITGYTQSEKPSQYFKSDDPTKCAQAGVNGDVALSAHTGGTATCKAKAVCTHCGESYGDLGKHNYLDGVCTVCSEKMQIYWGVDAATETTVATLKISGAEADVTEMTKSGSFDFDFEFAESYQVPWTKDAVKEVVTAGNITNVIIGEGVAPVYLSRWFEGFTALTNVDLSKLDTRQVKSMINMFSLCTSLTSLDLSNFDFSDVERMDNLFDRCQSLASITFPETVNLEKVTYMNKMFYQCKALSSVDLSAFRTKEVITMNGMFQGCEKLTSVTFPETFDTSKVINMGAMFFSSGFKSLDLSTFDTSSLKYTDSMFGANVSLTSVNISSFDTSQVIKMNNMFQSCSELTNIIFPEKFDISNVTDMSYMFMACNKLTDFKLSASVTADAQNSVSTNMSWMFYGCESLTSLDLSSFDSSNATDIRGMFYNCGKLTSLNLSSLDMGRVEATKTSSMLTGCDKLATIKTPATIGGSVSIALPATFWNGTADVEAIASASAGKILKLHAGHSYEDGVCSVCGDEAFFEIESGNEKTYFKTFAEAWAAANEAGTATVKMLADAVTDSSLLIRSGKNITLDLNGYKLEFDSVSGSEIEIWGNFILTDTYEGSDRKHTLSNPVAEAFGSTVEITGGVITGGTRLSDFVGGVAEPASSVEVRGGTFEMTGGTLACNEGESVVRINTGSFVMSGGAISYNDVVYGSVQVVLGKGTMSGGEISGNKAVQTGGGVYARGTFEMTGGKIYGNSAARGGGVYVQSDVFTMTGGEISGNSANKGGGVYVVGGTDCKTVLDGGKICDNTAAEYGGGIYLTTVSDEENACVLEIKSGEISGNEVTKNGSYGGGGICIDDGCKVIMTGGKITDNTTYAVAGDPNEHYGIGGGVLINNGTFEMSGGEISGNTSVMGGGVAVSGIVTAESAVMKLSGGVVSGNTGSGGILVMSDQLLELSGNPVVKSNAQSNGVVADLLPYGNVKAAGALTEGADIGVYVVNANSPVVKDYGTYNTEAADTFFVSNRSKYCFRLNGVDLELKEHEYETEFTVDKAATCTENGSKSRHCIHCDSKTEVTEIPATGHSHLTHHGAVEATTDSAGNTEYWSCADCDKYFSDEGGETEIVDKASVVIPKLAPKTPEEKKSYVWICWLLIPLAVAAGGIACGIYLYKKNKMR